MAIKSSRGFTLVELMITLAVLAILISIALPSFREMIAAQRVREAASALYDSLLIARSEAIKRGAAVTVTPDDSASGLPGGWKVLLSDGTTSIRTQEALSGVSVSMSPSTVTLAYSALGRLTSATTVVTLSGDGTSKQWAVRAEASGRVCVAEGGGTC